MSTLTSPAFLSRLESLYSQASSSGVTDNNPWYIVAAVAYSASNAPEAVSSVFLHVLKDLEARNLQHDEKLLLARKMRDALFKSGLTSGYAKAINSLVALHEVTPEDLRDKKPLRKLDTDTVQDYVQGGEAFFKSVYGETAVSVQGLLDSIYPDMGWFSNTIGYGLTYGFTDVTSQIETSYTLVAALIAGDTPRQIGWHLAGARRGGATLGQVKAVRQIVIEVATEAGVVWKNKIPDVEEAV